jgi:hypothetical protein
MFDSVVNIRIKPEDAVKMLYDSQDKTVFVFSYWRWWFKHPNYYKFSAPFNDIHWAAAREFVLSHFGASPFVVFQYRSETVPDQNLIPCSHDMAAAAKRLPQVNPNHSLALLVSDLSAPNNQRPLWNDYVGGNDATRHTAVKPLLEAGFVKYDVSHPNTDNGVLALRDYIFTQMSPFYVACTGDFDRDCHACFRTGSNFVSRVQADRERRGMHTFKLWFNVKPGEMLEEGFAVPAG